MLLTTATSLGATLTAIALRWPWLFPLWGALLGGVTGSYAGCAVSRLSHGQSLRHPPSYCESCHHPLKAPDLIPVLSWLLSAGRCRYCRARIGLAALVWDAAFTLLGAMLTGVAQPRPIAPFLPLFLLLGVLAASGLAVLMHKRHTGAANSRR